MYFVTTLSYDQLATLIKDKRVCIDNADMVLGQFSSAVNRYLTERMGSAGYAIGIRGQITPASVNLLAKMDQGLNGNRVVLEAEIDESQTLSFDVAGLAEAAEILAYGLPDEDLFEQLDSSITPSGSSPGIEVICIPAIEKIGSIRITSLNREIDVKAAGISFVKLGQ